MNAFLLEKSNLKLAADPVDANAAAITGARIGLQKADRVSVVLQMGDSTSAVVQLSLQQHSAASGGTTKALSIANPYYYKAGAATSFTKVVPGSAAASYDVSTQFADEPGILVLEVLGEDLDVDGGFGWISANLADSTAAKIVSICYVQSALRFAPGYSEAI